MPSPEMERHLKYRFNQPDTRNDSLRATGYVVYIKPLN